MIFNQQKESVEKGPLNLTKEDGLLDLRKFSDLENATVVAGWKEYPNRKDSLDIDVAAFLLGADEKVHDLSTEVVYFNKKQQCGIRLLKDQRSGATGTSITEDDEEKIEVKLNKIPNHIQSILFVATVFEAESRKQVFGNTQEAYIKLLNTETKEELLRFTISGKEYQMDTAIVFCRLVRNSSGWSFETIGQGYVGTLNTVLMDFYRKE